MKAAVRREYCGPEGIRIEEIPVPVPKENEILVRVRAATVNRTDCGVLTGRPSAIRLFAGLSRPRHIVTGTDFAGDVAAIGKQVTSFKVGDKVWGFDDTSIGSHAEYVAVPVTKAVLPIPSGLTYEQAVACAEGAHYAYNFINKVKLTPNTKIIINGATGAIGSSALQLLTAMGLRVTAVCATEHVELVRSLGAVRVLDRMKEDFTKLDEQFDFVFDAVGKSRFSLCKYIMKPKATYISTELGPNWENIRLALTTPFGGGKKVIFPLPFNIKKSMEHMKKLVEEGKFKPVIDRTYPLDDIASAFKFTASGQKIGNIVVTM